MIRVYDARRVRFVRKALGNTGDGACVVNEMKNVTPTERTRHRVVRGHSREKLRLTDLLPPHLEFGKELTRNCPRPMYPPGMWRREARRVAGGAHATGETGDEGVKPQ